MMLNEEVGAVQRNYSKLIEQTLIKTSYQNQLPCNLNPFITCIQLSSETAKQFCPIFYTAVLQIYHVFTLLNVPNTSNLSFPNLLSWLLASGFSLSCQCPF